jgi:hypothetical protein
MFDLNAPIIPGESAAGVRIGQPIEDILAWKSPDAVVEIHSCTKFEFGVVHLWVENGKVSQVGVCAGYRGSLMQGLGIGSTLGDIQSSFGPVVEDEDDNLIVEGRPGWCFETEEWMAGRQPEQNPNARVSQIYVFAVAA